VARPALFTLVEFRTRFPAFANAADALVEAVILEAAGELDPATWTDTELLRQGQMYRTADILASEPYARDMRLNPVAQGGKAPAGQTSLYRGRFEALRESMAGGGINAGSCGSDG